MLSCLPAQDPHPERRARQLVRAREAYRWSYEYPPGVAMAASLPAHEAFSLAYLARVLELDVRVAANHASALLGRVLRPGASAPRRSLRRRLRELDAAAIMSAASSTTRALSGRLWGALESAEGCAATYAALFSTLEAPACAAFYRRDRDPREQDLMFAWQRVAGVNPMVLRRVDRERRALRRLPITDALYRRVMGDDSLAAASAEGRLYVADYALLDDLPRARADSGREKFIYAPIALFAWQRPSGAAPVGALVPVAIQCEQTPGPETPIWTPLDGWRWRMAKTAVQIADGNHHQTITHLAFTHMIAEAFIVSAHRQLAELHPVHALLRPHFEFTLAINDTASHNLIAPGGEVEAVLGTTLEGSLSLTAGALAGFELARRLPAGDLRARGLDDREALPECPYRDDILPLWEAIHDWVDGYLRVFYREDVDVRGDAEVQAWVRELAAPGGGRLPGVGGAPTIAALARLVAFFIWTVSAQHSAVNFSQYAFMSYVPNMPGAGYAPAPGPFTPDTEESWRAMLTPLEDAIRQRDIVFQLSNIQKNKLGRYPALHFPQRAVQRRLSAFQARLAELEIEIAARERGRLLPYPFLMPSRIPQSIHI
ncbi:MAG: lipoxygenase [Myxococcales bacterium]|nr:lipoxygenase [Myxococcales bacterium]